MFKISQSISLFGLIIILSASGIFFANIKNVSAEGVCAVGKLTAATAYLDMVDIGDPVSETGHLLSGWSDANLAGSYGGCEQGQKCSYRQTWEPDCAPGKNTASFSLTVPAGFYANALEFRHLDGFSAYDSLNIYVNGTRVIRYEDHGGSEEKWLTASASLADISGVLTIVVEATDAARSECGLYGQLSFDWIGIRGYSCELGRIEGCNYQDNNGSGIISAGSAKLSGWDLALEYCGEGTVNAAGESEFVFNINDICSVYARAVTGPDGCFSFSGLKDGKYRLKETVKDGWTQTMPEGADYNIGVQGGDQVEVNFANYNGKFEEEPGFYCGNGLREYFEACDGNAVQEGYYCTVSCGLEPIPAASTSTEEALAPLGGDEATVVLGEAGAPNLSIGKVILNQNANNSDLISEKIFKITVANNGNLAAYAVNVVDNLPEGLVFDGTEETSKEWFLGDIEAGAIKNITYLVDITASATPGIYTNVAQAFATNHSPVTATADIIVGKIQGATAPVAVPAPVPAEEPEVLGEVGAPKLTIGKTADRTAINIGAGQLEYTITVVNEGNMTAYAVTLVDTLYGGLIHADTGEPVRVWSLGDLLPGEIKLIKYKVDVGGVEKTGTYTNTAVAYASNSAPVTASLAVEVKGSAIGAPMGGEAPASAKLPETGFDNIEFIILVGVMLTLAAGAAILRKRFVS